MFFMGKVHTVNLFSFFQYNKYLIHSQKMKSFYDIMEEQGNGFVDSLMNDYVTVTERLSGSSFSFSKSETGELLYYKGKENRPLDEVSRALTKYYEDAISHIDTVTAMWKDEIPTDWHFVFQYFKKNKPSHVYYDHVPSNKLILTHIYIPKKRKTIEDENIIKKWAERFNVDYLKPVFSGYLNDTQKTKIKEYLFDRLKASTILDENSFAQFIVNTLNPNLNSTTLQDDLSKPVDSYVFKFYRVGSAEPVCIKLSDPFTLKMISKIENATQRIPYDVNEMILLDFMTYVKGQNLDKAVMVGNSPEYRYIELICYLFNDYYKTKKGDLPKLDIEHPEFDDDDFVINFNFIPNETTLNILKSSKNVETIFKIILGSFRKYRSSSNLGNIMTPYVISNFNILVDDIRETAATKKVMDDHFMTFDELFNK